MTTMELDAKVQELRDLRNYQSEVNSAISLIEETLKAEMLLRNTDILAGRNCLVTWKTTTSRRFDSASFKLTHAELFNQYSKATTSRRLVIA